MFPLAVLERAFTHDHFASTATTSADFAFISFSADSFAAFLALMTFFFASISLFRDLSSFCFAFIDSSSISFASASVFSASLIAALNPAIFSFCDFTASSAAL